MHTPLEILKHYWKYPAFRGKQAKIIESVLAGKDTLALLPTGGGKSITFQIAGLAKDGLCIVVSPLIALMNDQVSRLNSLGIKAIAFSGKLHFQEQLRILDNAVYGAYKFLYISPERLQSELFQSKLQEMNINLLAIDEAHCISQWGHDFRPSYRKIAPIREILPNIPVLALTATATPEVVTDICEQLQFKSPVVIQQSFERSNLTYTVAKRIDKISALERLFNRNKTASIIYVRSRYLCHELSEQLSYLGFQTTIYHAGLALEEREANFKKWLTNEAPIMIATNAFGMGIDKADVRWVVHYNIPESIESYFQEAGRAGRDGEASHALLLYNGADIDLLKNQFLTTTPEISFIKTLYKKLCQHFSIAYNQKNEQAQDFDFYHFCEHYQFNKNKSVKALQILHREGIIALSENFGNQSSIQFSIDANEMVLYMDRSKKMKPLIQFLLRNNGGAFETFVRINEYKIANKLSVSKNAIIEQLQFLEEEQILIYNNTNTDYSISFLQIRQDDKTINHIQNNVKQLHKQQLTKIKAMLDFVNQRTVCSSRYLLTYFGEKKTSNCGKCTICRKQNQLNEKQYNTLATHILESVSKIPKTAKEISKKLELLDTDLLLETIQLLLDQKRLMVNKYNQYYLNEK